MPFITEIPRELLQNKEFPRGGANPRGCQPIIWPNIIKYCIEMKKIYREGGARSKFYDEDPPLHYHQYNSHQTPVVAQP